MAVASAPLPPNSDAIQSVGRVLPWLASIPDRSRFAFDNLARTSDRETRDAVAGHERALRELHDSLDAAATAMMDKLRSEVEAAPAGTTMDPEGTGIQALEEAERFFRNQCTEFLGDIRNTLELSGDRSGHGKGVFRELDRLERLYFRIAECCQEVRWLLMINDGAQASTTGKTFTSGAELVASLTAE